MDSEVELHLRRLIFERLREIVEENGVVTRVQLEALRVGDDTVRVIDRNRGIRNPREMLATLSVVSNPAGPYDDVDVGESLYLYDYRAGSVEGDNTKLRRACDLQLPIILLRTLRPGVFSPVFPVYVVLDDRPRRRFVLALDEELRAVADPLHLSPLERRYALRAVRQRVHQPEFRGRIMLAYDRACTVCRLRHGRLLDAAHIIGDHDERGVPTVDNGLSMCKIHHAAYDADLLGISPDHRIAINADLMREVDGPMLRHGLQEMDGASIVLPTRRADRPDRDRLAERWAQFRAS